jgi:hypothetical protein
MRLSKILVLGIIVSLIFISQGLVIGEEAVEKGGAIPETEIEPETQWVWGEAISVDTQNKTILVKYFDYETGQEKEININVDDKTTYENINSMDEIEPKDNLSIDYITMQEGKNIATNISLEKPEAEPVLEPENLPPVEETLPEATITQ